MSSPGDIHMASKPDSSDAGAPSSTSPSPLDLAPAPDAQTDGATVQSFLSAAATGDVWTVSKMLGEGTPANCADYDKRVALHLASAEGHTEVVKLLVSKGANINFADRWGNTPLQEAIRGSQHAVVKVLKENGASLGDDNSAALEVITAASAGNLDAVKNIVQAGVDPNKGDYDGRTPLHLAVAEGHLDVVQFLLGNGADVNAKDRWGKTPLNEATRNAARTGSDAIVDALMEHGGVSNADGEEGPKKFAVIGAVMEFLFVILFGVFTEYDPAQTAPRSAAEIADATIVAHDTTFASTYPFYQDVHVMIFIGFGFLMSFLRKHGYTATGFTFVLGAFMIQWHILAGGFMHNLFNDHWEKIPIDLSKLLVGDFAAAACLISFGALIGKVSPTQMLVMCFVEIIIFSVNENIGLELGISDIGGSMVVHIFGAYFGLGASLMVTPKTSRGRSDNSAVYHSDMFAMIGTIFLWLFWPSFNGGPSSGHFQHRVVVNTVLSLTGSCLVSFYASMLMRPGGKFEMVDVQNATLAGGVAVGAIADMNIKPWGALLIGCVAGVLSVVGYVHIQPFLERKISLYDTCGVHNLHGMPGVLSGVASAIVAAGASSSSYQTDLLGLYAERGTRSAAAQAGVQAAFMFITLAISVSGGVFTGTLMRLSFFQPAKDQFFQDTQAWHVPEMENPYYFDKRGEIGHKEAKPASSQAKTSALRNPEQASPGEEGLTLRTVSEKIDTIAAAIGSFAQRQP